MRGVWRFTGVLIGLCCACPGTRGAELIAGGQARGTIVIPAAPNKGEEVAATELQRVLKKATGVELPIARTDAAMKGPAIVVGRHRQAAAARASLAKRLSSFEAFAEVGSGTQLALVGNSQTATVYAAWDWLERAVGVRWLLPGPHGEYVPRLERIALERGARYDAPKLPFRWAGVWYSNTQMQLAGAEEYGMAGWRLFELRRRMNSYYGIVPQDGLGYAFAGHSYCYQVPPSLFAEHPDWFNMIGGQRLSTQVCFTSTGAQEYAAQSVLAAVARIKERQSLPNDRFYIFVTPNDGVAICECPTCAKLLDKDGSATSMVFHFANEVAKRVRAVYPGVWILCMAYSNYSTAPDHVRPGPGVAPMLAYWTSGDSFGINHAKPGMSAGNAKFRDQFRKWSAMSEAVTTYPYYGHYGWFTPWPKATQIATDMRVQGADPKFIGLLPETQGNFGGNALNYYLLARLAWNPAADPETVQDDFCRAAYGPAARPLRAYYRLLQARMDAQAYIGGIVVEIPQVLTPEVIREADGLMALAEAQLPAMDADMQWRTRLAIEAWRASAQAAEAMRLYRSSTTAEDRVRIVALLDAVEAFSKTERGEWAFHEALVATMMQNIRTPLAAPLDALPPGETTVSDAFNYGGALKFLGTVRGFEMGMWGIGLTSGQRGEIELPLAAQPGHRITRVAMQWTIEGAPALRATMIGADGTETVISEGRDALGRGVTVPLPAGAARLRLRLAARNQATTPGNWAWLIGMRVTATVE